VIEMSDQAVSVLWYAMTSVRHCRVESWLDGDLLADNVPITGGAEFVDRTARIHERVTLVVPREVDGVDWSPLGDPVHPLAANGQRLRIMMGVELEAGEVEWIQRGEYLIQRSEPRDDQVDVEAVGLLALIDEARLVSPYQPSGTLVSTVRGLVEPALTVSFDPDLVDRAVPAGINYDEDRLGALQEVLNAWPAQARVTNDGYLLVEPVTVPTTYDFQLDDRVTIDMAGESGREGVYTAVVARGTAADGAQVQGVAYDESTGPHRHGGPFNPLPVPFYFPSPLLTTVAQAQAAARTRLAKLQRESGRPLVATLPPMIHIHAGDVAGVLTEDDVLVCTIEGTTLPLLAGGGAMELVLVEVPS
jgi:hypothetical protein